jgi:tetratricopeptide (TPR) repeat protein
VKNFIDHFYLKISILVIALLLANSSNAQKKTGKYVDPAEAKEHFNHGNFLSAIPVYKQLLKQDPKNVEYNHNIGTCYLHTYINRTLAIPYLETASKQPEAEKEKEIWYDLGLAYQYASRLRKI